MPIYEEDKCRLFALGRNAIYAACEILKIKAGDEVLTPAFDCDGSKQPFNVLGCSLKFIQSDPYTFNIDIEDIKKKITTKTKLIHVINHFGFPQPWNELTAVREKFGIPILEDNAYSLFSKYQGRMFGTFGDLSIFSLRKNLPLLDGGMLRINNPDYKFKCNPKKPKLFYPTEWSGLFSIVKRAFGVYKTPEIIRQWAKKINPLIEPPPPLYSEPEKGYPEWSLRDQIGHDFSCDYMRPMSIFAKFQLNKYSTKDFTGIINNKIKYYSYLSDKLSDIKNIKILHPVLAEGTVPFCFSFLIESNRDAYFSALRKKYDCMAWPTLPQAVIEQLDNFPEIEILGRKVLQLNLPADKILIPGYPTYLKNFVDDLVEISNKYQ